jgi:hypothetical protein
MALPTQRGDREHSKFASDEDLGTVVKTLTKIYGAIDASFRPSGLSIGGKMTEIALTTAWVPIPAAALADRNTLIMQNQSDNEGVILINYNNTSGSVGFRLYDGGMKVIGVSDTITLYARMLSGTGKILIDEVA